MGKTKYYKHPQFGHVYGQSLPTPVGALCWLYLAKPKDAPPPQEGQPQGAPRYEATLLLQKNIPPVTKFVAELKTMTDEMLELFNHKRSAALGTCLLFGKYGDGDEADHEKYPYYKGMHVLIARNVKPVKVVDKNRKLIESEADIAGGMEGKFVICPIITAHGVSYKLEAVQLVKDGGVRFGGAARDAVELFDACGDDDVESDTNSNVAENGSEPEPPQKAAKKGKAAALDLL